MDSLTFAKILIQNNPEIFRDSKILEIDGKITKGNLLLNYYMHIGQMLCIAKKARNLILKEKFIALYSGPMMLSIYEKWRDLMKTQNNIEINNKTQKNIEILIKFLKNYLGKKSILEIMKISQLDPVWNILIERMNENKLENKMNMKFFEKNYQKIFQKELKKLKFDSV